MNVTAQYVSNLESFQKANALLTVNKESAHAPFEIRTLDWMVQNQWQTDTAPGKNNFFEIIWVQKGKEVELKGLERFITNNNSIYCISPGQVHFMQTTKNLQGYVIHFSFDFLSSQQDNYDLIFNSGLFNPFGPASIIKPQDTMENEMAEIAEMMLKEFDNYSLLRSEILRGYLKSFMIYLTRQHREMHQKLNPRKKSNLVKRFTILLDNNFTTKRMVADYANDLHITPNYLNQIVKNITGIPVSEHIKQRIILEAKRQASYTPASMKEIAYNLGFKDTSHFSKFFKKACGINFTNFKNEMSIS